jgi:hypothetical protein
LNSKRQSSDFASYAGSDERSQGRATYAPALPHAKSLTGDKGYDSDAFRKTLIDKGIEPCIPPKKHGALNLTARPSTGVGTKSKTALRASMNRRRSHPLRTPRGRLLLKHLYRRQLHLYLR